MVGVTVGTGVNKTSVWSPTEITDPTTVTARNTVTPTLPLPTGLTAPKAGQQLTVNRGTWLYTYLGGITYRWQACTTADASSCTDLSGQTLTRYTPSTRMIARRLRVVVTYTGSDKTKVVAATPISKPVTN
jgi:hypothetical protein